MEQYGTVQEPNSFELRNCTTSNPVLNSPRLWKSLLWELPALQLGLPVPACRIALGPDKYLPDRVHLLLLLMPCDLEGYNLLVRATSDLLVFPGNITMLFVIYMEWKFRYFWCKICYQYVFWIKGRKVIEITSLWMYSTVLQIVWLRHEPDSIVKSDMFAPHATCTFGNSVRNRTD